jgi:uncharacterized protein
MCGIGDLGGRATARAFLRTTTRILLVMASNAAFVISAYSQASPPANGADPGCPSVPAGTVGGGGQIFDGPRVPGAPGARSGGPRRDPYAGMTKVLFLGDISEGAQNAHEISVGTAMATLSQLARKNNMMMLIRTDTHNFTKDPIYGQGDYAKCGPKEARGRSLDFFDVVVLYVNGELNLNDKQKNDLLSFVKEDGKGIVAIHTATAAGYYWPEYGEMIGGYFDDHPWGVVDTRVIVERPDFPGMQAFVADPHVRDEMYAMTPSPYSRDKVDVLMRLDTSTLDMNNPEVHRIDNDFPIAWIKNYGKGRVFYSCFGHPDAAWDDPRVQSMYIDAIRWAAGLVPYTVQPHPIPAVK